MHRSLADRVNASLDRFLPEQRLFLRSDSGTRFVRLRPLTQLAALGGTAVIFGWSVIASAVLVTETLGSGNARDQITRTQAAFEGRLDELAAERDQRAAEAAQAQARFATALDQVSRMQSQLLTSEQQRRELEAGISAVQANLDEALARPAEVQTAADTTAAHGKEMSVALDILSGELQGVAEARQKAEAVAVEAQARADKLAVEKDAIVARNDEILAQIEDAVSVSTDPLDKMFKSVGLNPDKVLATVREGYSGQGGPLTPMAYSSSGNAAISQSEARGTEIMVSLDKLNTYRIAAQKLPLAMPVQSAFRYTSGFGTRWGRKHEGIDMAAPVGTPIYSTGEGTVIFAGWQRGYGNVIKIQHELGTETRYGHLSRMHVKAGQKVSRGSRIGDMGNTGRSTGPHLHYEVRVNGAAVNPLSFIKAAQNVF